MASGKTTTGKELADYFGWEFIDSDEEIVRLANKTVVEIFAEQKEAGFRFLESETFARILQKASKDVVIASGGGLLLNEQNRKMVSGPKIVFLDTDFAEIMRRLPLLRDSRPLLKGLSQQKIREFYVQRRKKYLEYADFVVKNTDEMKDLFHRLKLQELNDET